MRDEGYTLSNRSDMFVHVEDTIPKLKWFNMRYGDKKTFSVAWNYYLQGMRQKMIKTANLLYDTYLQEYDSSENARKIVYSSIWNGTEQSSCNWHNDLLEGANVFFLLYFTDMDPNNGGEIMFRNMEENKRITAFHMPRKYDVILASQDLKFEHRVEHFRAPCVERITMNFGFNIKNSPWT